MNERMPGMEMPQNENAKKLRPKSPHFISPKLLAVLGGIKTDTEAGALVDEGAYLWGVEDKEKGAGILKHVLLTSRVAYALAKALKEKQVAEYEDIDAQNLVEAAILHDVTKLYGEDREKLTAEKKNAIGLDSNFREIMPEVDEIGIAWLKERGFPPAVYEAIRGHDFPEEIINDPYWKIILVADYMSGQKIMTVGERMQDVRTRWIDQRLAQGQEPRIEPERFEKASKNIRLVADEIFGALNVSDEEFIEKNKLNDGQSMTRWEEFLLQTKGSGRERRAKELVDHFIK